MLFYLMACISLYFKRSYVVLVTIILVFMVAIYSFDLDGYFYRFYKEVPFLEFLYGLILHRYNGTNRKNSKEYRFELFAILALVIYLISIDISGFGHFGHRMFWRGLPAFFIVGLFLRLENLVVNRLDKSIVYSLGAISYAMYLFHPFVVFGIKRILLSNFDFLLVDFLGLIISLFGTIAAAYFVWRKVEVPLTNKLRSYYGKKV